MPRHAHCQRTLHARTRYKARSCGARLAPHQRLVFHTHLVVVAQDRQHLSVVRARRQAQSTPCVCAQRCTLMKVHHCVYHRRRHCFKHELGRVQHTLQHAVAVQRRRRRPCSHGRRRRCLAHGTQRVVYRGWCPTFTRVDCQRVDTHTRHGLRTRWGMFTHSLLLRCLLYCLLCYLLHDFHPPSYSDRSHLRSFVCPLSRALRSARGRLPRTKRVPR